MRCGMIVFGIWLSSFREEDENIKVNGWTMKVMKKALVTFGSIWMKTCYDTHDLYCRYGKDCPAYKEV